MSAAYLALLLLSRSIEINHYIIHEDSTTNLPIRLDFASVRHPVPVRHYPPIATGRLDCPPSFVTLGTCCTRPIHPPSLLFPAPASPRPRFCTYLLKLIGSYASPMSLVDGPRPPSQRDGQHAPGRPLT